MSIRAAGRSAVVLAAAAAALLPLPESWIERWYSNGIYPSFQTRMTTAGNAVGVALFDVLIAVVAVVAIVRSSGEFAGGGRPGSCAPPQQRSGISSSWPPACIWHSCSRGA